MMHYVLRDITFARVYIDEVMIFSLTVEEHIEHLVPVLELIMKHYLNVKFSKCYFAQSRVRLLGTIVDARGAQVDDDKIYNFVHSPTPTTRTGLRSFL